MTVVALLWATRDSTTWGHCQGESTWPALSTLSSPIFAATMDTTVPPLHCTMVTTVQHSTTRSKPCCIIRLPKTQCASYLFSAPVVSCCELVFHPYVPVVLCSAIHLLVRVPCIVFYGCCVMFSSYVSAVRRCAPVVYLCSASTCLLCCVLRLLCCCVLPLRASCLARGSGQVTHPELSNHPS